MHSAPNTAHTWSLAGAVIDRRRNGAKGRSVAFDPGSHGTEWNLPASILAGVILDRCATPGIAVQMIETYLTWNPKLPWSDRQRIGQALEIVRRY